MSNHRIRLSPGDNHRIRLSPGDNYNATLAGIVAPRKFSQLIDVNMIGVANGDLVTYDEATKTFIPTPRAQFFSDEVNILYVSKGGNDNNNGKSIQEAKLTLDSAINIATPGTVIKVYPGNYTINNPVTLPDQISITGEGLREVSIGCSNPGDLFYIGNGNYISDMSFTGAANSGAIFSFDPNQIRYINQSPYIQNCTNFIPNSVGLKIDGNNAIGPIKSMVLDSYTQYNQGGIGVSITNGGYAQLVSLFTICNNIAVYCGTGGGCDLTNSNSSFGNYGLVADGLSPLKYSGNISQISPINSDTFVVGFNNPEIQIANASYNNLTGNLTVYTATPHKFSVGMGVTLSGLGFTCSYEPGIRYYPSGQKGYVFEVKTVTPGRYIDASNLINANKTEIVDKSLAAIALNHPDFIFPGDNVNDVSYRYKDSYRLIQQNKTEIVNAAWANSVAVYPSITSTETKCKRDIGYFVDAVSTDLFTGGNSYVIGFTKQYFNSVGSATSALLGEEAQSIHAFNIVRDYAKKAITNQLNIKDLTLTADPITGFNTSPVSCANVQSTIDTLVGIATQAIGAGNLISISNIAVNSGIFLSGQSKCRRDIGYIVDAVSSDVRNYTNEKIILAAKSYFTSSGTPISNGLVGETAESITAFNAVGTYSKLAINNMLNVKDLTVAIDPATGSNTSPASCANVRTNIDNLVSVITTTIGIGNTSLLPPVSKSSTQFTVTVGVATQAHTYVPNTGIVKNNIVRPFDGQSIHFDKIYYTVNKINIQNGGSGYTKPPTVIIESPSTSWGISAQAVVTIKGGSVATIEIVSNGRGYTSIPNISFSSPDVGLNTARASIEILPTYHSIQSSTPISSSGICTITLSDIIPYLNEIGTDVYFYKQSRILASGHSLEYIGSGVEITTALPAFGGVPIQENEIDARNGGLVIYTSTDQSGNFRIGDGVIIDQQSGQISGKSYSKSLLSQMTPYILALGGE